MEKKNEQTEISFAVINNQHGINETDAIFFAELILQRLKNAGIFVIEKTGEIIVKKEPKKTDVSNFVFSLTLERIIGKNKNLKVKIATNGLITFTFNLSVPDNEDLKILINLGNNCYLFYRRIDEMEESFPLIVDLLKKDFRDNLSNFINQFPLLKIKSAEDNENFPKHKKYFERFEINFTRDHIHPYLLDVIISQLPIRFEFRKINPAEHYPIFYVSKFANLEKLKDGFSDFILEIFRKK